MGIPGFSDIAGGLSSTTNYGDVTADAFGGTVNFGGGGLSPLMITGLAVVAVVVIVVTMKG